MAAFAESRTWKSTRQNDVVVAEMTVMHGGPAGMCLLEHEHSEIQIGEDFAPVGRDCLELGFVSQSHFTSAFHREVRSTPQSYRSLVGRPSN
jgi:AraC-like DNA-binding protein